MPSVITQEIHIIKRIFGENVIDSMINTIKDAIKNAPNSIAGIELPSALQLFEDVMYDDNDVKRMVEFKQYGPLYICKVIDVTSTKPYAWLAYSLFDILETYNSGNRNNTSNVQYIKLFESDKDNTYSVSAVEAPKNYNTNNCMYDDEKALNEIGKYKISFKDNDNNEVTVDVVCNPHLLQVSNPYTNLDYEDLFDKEFVYGRYNLIVDGVYHHLDFYFDPTTEIIPNLEELIKESDVYKENENLGKAIKSFTYDNVEYSGSELANIMVKSEVKDINIVFNTKISVIVNYNTGIEEDELSYFVNEKTFADIKNDISSNLEFPDNGPESPQYNIDFTVTDSLGETKIYEDDDIINENINILVSITEIE